MKDPHNEVTRPGNRVGAGPEFVSNETSVPDGRRAPLIGRGPELRELEEIIGRALLEETPEIVTVIGSPGIGKSRLLDDLLKRLDKREAGARAYRAVCREDGPAYGVIERLLRRRFGLLDGAAAASAEASFRAAVSETLDDRRVSEFVHFLGALVGLQFPDSPFIRAVEDDPEQFSKISGVVLRRFLETDAAKRPLVLVLEDLQWAPDDTLELVSYLMRSLRGVPIVLLCAARPELLARRADWLECGGDHHSRMELAPLAPDDSASLMYHLLEPLPDPPEELVDAAVDMAGGSPYLLEQMVQAFLATGTLRENDDGGWSVDLERLDEAQLPLSVDDAIRARISALTPSERDLLEMAATTGSVFWLGGLVALARMDEKTPELWGGHASAVDHLRDLLAGLVDRDYLLELPDSGIYGDTEYAFKHNLERQTIDRLTNRHHKRRFHQVIGEWLEFRLAERAEEQCELLAYHFEAGGATAKAAGYYLLAGDKARARYANTKAAEYYALGLELLGDADVVRRIDALHHYGDVLQLAGRNDAALEAFRAMLAIAFRLDLRGKGGAAHNRIGRLYRAIGQLDEAMRHLGTGNALFDAAGDVRGVASTLDDVGKVHWMRGNYEAAERFMHQALERRQDLGDQRSIALSFNNLGLVYQDSGRFGEAQNNFQEALVLRRAIDDQPGIAQTLNNLGTIAQDNGDHAGAIELYNEALAVAREVGDRMRQAVILTNLGESKYRLGDPNEAIAVLTQAEELSTTLGDRILEGEILRGLAKAHVLVHEIRKARDYIARSIELFSKAKPFLGVALRTEAEIYAAAGWGNGADHQKARGSFERSLSLFEELGNDVEIANTCRSFASFLEQNPDSATDPVLAHELMSLRSRAMEIRDRMAESEGEGGLPPLPGEATHPSV
ncbi:MAG: tetratricopeptide repeat protein [Myxococcota bacterium]